MCQVLVASSVVQAELEGDEEDHVVAVAVDAHLVVLGVLDVLAHSGGVMIVRGGPADRLGSCSTSVLVFVLAVGTLVWVFWRLFAELPGRERSEPISRVKTNLDVNTVIVYGVVAIFISLTLLGGGVLVWLALASKVTPAQDLGRLDG